MRNRLFGSVVLVSTAIVLAVGCGNSDDSEGANSAQGSDAGTQTGDASTGGSNDASSGTGTDASSGGGNDGAASTGDSGTGTKSDAGGTKAVPAPTSMCAAAKVTLNPSTEVLLTNTAENTKNLATGDFNNDGAADIAVLVNDGIDVFFSKKDGTFSAPLNLPDEVGNGPGFAVGDFSGDGIPDIVVSSFGTDTVDDMVDLFVSNGDGTFKPLAEFADQSTNLFQMVTGDFNKDGKLDLLYNGQDAQGLLLNNGQGFSSPGTMVNIPVDQDLFAVGDFNGDGADDVVYADSTNGACILSNNGSGTFGTAKCYAAIPGQGPDIAITGDVNGDGKTDVVTIYDGHGGIDQNQKNVAVYFSNGDGTLGAAAVASTIPSIVDGALIVDTNNDGKGDIVTFDGTSITVLLNDGTGKFTGTPATYGLASGSGSAEFPVVTGDFLGDGLRGFAALDETQTEGIAVITATCSK